MRTRTATPWWVKAAVVALLVGAPAWWLVQRHDRVTNEARLAAVASEIAGRAVRVRCPGVVARAFSWEILEGSVRFDAAGRPADETQLRQLACGELDALAEGRRGEALACAERGGAGCGRAAADLALAVNVLAHEAWHLAGIADEALAECRSTRTVAWAARRLGASAAQGEALARVYVATGHQRLPARYRGGAC